MPHQIIKIVRAPEAEPLSMKLLHYLLYNERKDSEWGVQDISANLLEEKNKDLGASLKAAKRAIAALKPYAQLYFARNPQAGELTAAGPEEVEDIITYHRIEIEKENNQ